MYQVKFMLDRDEQYQTTSTKYPLNRVSDAVIDARSICITFPFAKAQVINAKTHAVIWDSEEEVKNHPDGWIAHARRM